MMSVLATGCIEILLVEDNPGDVYLVTKAFGGLGMPNHVNVVSNGREALHFLLRRDGYAAAPRPDIIVLDLNMPVMNGHEFFAAFMEDPRMRSIPLVVLTGSEAEREAMVASGLPPTGYFIKPSSLEEYAKVVRCIMAFRQDSIADPLP